MPNAIDFISVFTIALSSAFGHCIGMCGGIVIAYSQITLKSGFLARILSHFIYGFGRITTYSIIGMISAFIGSGFFINDTAKGGFFIFIGIFMIILGISLLFLPKILALFEFNISNFTLFKKCFAFILQKQNLFAIYILGILNGALPCGIVYFFALSASVSGGICNGALVMIVFGMATLVPLVPLGIFSSLLQRIKYRKTIHAISSLFIIFFGIYTCIKGINILLGATSGI